MGGDDMKCTLWDSSAVQPASEFDYYHTGLCEAFAHLTPYRPAAGARFSAKMEHWLGAANEFTFLQTVSHRVSRSKQDINQAEDNDIYLNFIERGELQFEQDGNRHVLKRGDLAIIDNAKPFDVQINAQKGHRHLAFRIKRDRIQPGSGELAARLNSHALTPALRNAVSYLCHANEHWLPERIATLAATIENLAVMIATGEAPPNSYSRAQNSLAQVRRQIMAHCTDPDFSLDVAAKNLRTPARSLQKHLQICGTSFSTLLIQTRLEQARQMLSMHLGGPGIEDICYRCGFNDLSTFYRSFKAYYGIAPGAYKNRIMQ
jgi:AraC family transcriptional regulator, positive regulator of tynA and feaB